MAETYLPSKEGELASFAQNFNTQINIDPAALGLTLAQASAFTSLSDAYVAAWTLVQEAVTRTTPNIAAKNSAKEALISGPGGIRELVNIIQSFPGTTNQQREALMITVPDPEPSPIPVPSFAPAIDILSNFARTIRIKLSDTENPLNTGKPDGVRSANVYTYVGDTAPQDVSEWTFAGNTTRVRYDITFPTTVPLGSKVWITAFWLNPRSESGPGTTPFSANLNFGGMSAAA